MRAKAYARLKVFGFCIEEEFLGIMGMGSDEEIFVRGKI